MIPPTALVLRALGMGDFFAGLPALNLLRTALPDHRVVLALPRALWPLAELAPCVDDTVEAWELTPIIAAPHQPDVAVDLHGNGMASVELLRATEPRRLVAFATGEARWRADEHEVHRWCRLVRESFGGTGLFPSVRGALPEVPEASVPAGTTVLHCGGKARSRRWPADRFAAVASELSRDGHDVLVVAGADQRGEVDRIADAAGVRGTTSLTLTDLVALVARARLLVCGDTGVAHVASNYGTASVVLFGPVPPDEWGPPAERRHQVVWHGTGRGDPHGDEPDRALLRITVDEVLDRAGAALQGLEDSTSSTGRR